MPSVIRTIERFARSKIELKNLENSGLRPALGTQGLKQISGKFACKHILLKKNTEHTFCIVKTVPFKVAEFPPKKYQSPQIYIFFNYQRV